MPSFEYETKAKAHGSQPTEIRSYVTPFQDPEGIVGISLLHQFPFEPEFLRFNTFRVFSDPLSRLAVQVDKICHIKSGFLFFARFRITVSVKDLELHLQSEIADFSGFHQEQKLLIAIRFETALKLYSVYNCWLVSKLLIIHNSPISRGLVRNGNKLRISLCRASFLLYRIAHKP